MWAPLTGSRWPQRKARGRALASSAATQRCPCSRRGDVAHEQVGLAQPVTPGSCGAERVTADVRALMATRPDEATAVRAVAEALAVSLERSGFRLGCPVSTAALELSSQSEAVREVCAQTYADWQRLIAAHAVTVGYDETAAQARAELVLAALEGAMLLARVARDGDVLRRTATSLVSPPVPR